MVYPVLGQILILSIVIINCSRIFFLKFGKIDSLTVLAPLAVILSFIQIAAWKADFFSFIILAISILNFFVNFRAFLRFISGLYVDHYSLGFKIGEIIIIILSAFELGILIFFFPISIFDNKFKSEWETIRVTGSFRTGFSKAPVFSKASGEVNVFTPVSENLPQKVVIFFPDKRAETERYIPFLKFLSEHGFYVVSSDLYSSDVKWFYSFRDIKFLRRASMIHSYLKNPVQFESEREFYIYNTMQECEGVYNFAKDFFPAECEFFMLGDEMTFSGVNEYAKTNKNISAVFNLAQLIEYNTKGFGFIENLEPILAAYFETPRKKNFDNIRACAEQTASFFEENSKSLKKAE